VAATWGQRTQHPPDLEDAVQPVEVVGAGHGPLLAAPEPAQSAGLGSLLGIVGRVPGVQVAVAEGRLSAGLSALPMGLAAAGALFHNLCLWGVAYHDQAGRHCGLL
jgi:hypothetical protein